MITRAATGRAGGHARAGAMDAGAAAPGPSAAATDARAPLGRRLVAGGIISADQLRIALTEQGQGDEALGRILVRLGFVAEAVMREQLGEALGRASIDLDAAVPDAAALALVPAALARRHRVVPVSLDPAGQRLALAMADPLDLVTLDRLRAQVGPGVELDPLLAGEAAVDTAIDRFYGHELSVDGILHEIETGEIDHASLQAGSGEYSQPLVRLVDALLADAVKREASDIHFEPEAGFVRIRYRIDGVLRQVRSLHARFWSPIAVRLKVMAGMNIAETRAPQDGRTELSIGGHAIDFRVSAVRTTHGENIVLRVLDRHKGIRNLDALGLDERNRDALGAMMARPEGIILVTGPTGSGKTTTLYSMLAHLNREGVNIVTLEDPVEYPLPLVRQSEVNEAARLDFADGIRSLMRQDPDIILVGEIRDEATATMALRAAMTGHQVYATLHTGSALGVVPRLLDIGVLPDLLAGHVIGALGQRLVRRLCPRCKTSRRPDERERRLLALDPDTTARPCHPVGCQACDGQGFRGRLPLVEVLRFDAELDERIARRATRREIREAARARGFVPLAADGVRRVLAGETSLAEVARVVDLGGGA
ncbi:MAG: ATPase, T2SS/T4P/T4SS family [Halofilum sp. (in: g-proteobacteria)]|nr:ATPase, T2SS/T4P/T4SS family [Halofilum sp. (in: g-proteobacteria)]